MVYKSMKEICEMSEEGGVPFWKVVQVDDCTERQVSPEASFETMREMYRAMKHADESYTGTRKSTSGMVGGDGKKLEQYVASGKSMSGGFIGKVMERAVKMAESNACMRRIVAAPTAGSCGVLPAVLLTYAEQIEENEERIVEALYTAAGIGQGDRAQSVDFGRFRRLSGGDRLRERDGGGRSCVSAGRRQRGNLLRGGDCLKKPARSDVRSDRRSCGSTVREAQCHRRGQCGDGGGYGHCRGKNSHSGG